MVTVYTSENCRPCKLTKRELKKLGVEFQEVSLASNPEKVLELAQEGFRATPVVETSTGERWVGFLPERLQGLAGA